MSEDSKMKRYLVIREHEGILGAADGLEAINAESDLDVIDTQTGIIWHYSGDQWYTVETVGNYKPESNLPWMFCDAIQTQAIK